MDNLNMANRQCADLDIRKYVSGGLSGEPWMFADFCNTTTAGFSGDSVFANKKGSKFIKFDNPIEATMSITFQAHPYKIYSLLSDGEIETSALITKREIIKCTTAGTLTVTGTPIAGTVFVYAEGDFGGNQIEGTYAASTYTATEASNIAVDSTYIVAYMESKNSGVKHIQFNDVKIPGYYRIQMETVDKDENGDLIPMLITGYKCSPQRNLELSFSSDGDPAEITITFDCMKSDDDNVLSITKIDE